MRYGKSKVLICEIMAFTRILWREEHPRDLLAKNQHFGKKLSLRYQPSYALMTPTTTTTNSIEKRKYN